MRRVRRSVVLQRPHAAPGLAPMSVDQSRRIRRRVSVLRNRGRGPGPAGGSLLLAGGICGIWALGQDFMVQRSLGTCASACDRLDDGYARFQRMPCQHSTGCRAGIPGQAEPGKGSRTTELPSPSRCVPYEAWLGRPWMHRPSGIDVKAARTGLRSVCVARAIFRTGVRTETRRR